MMARTTPPEPRGSRPQRRGRSSDDGSGRGRNVAAVAGRPLAAPPDPLLPTRAILSSASDRNAHPHLPPEEPRIDGGGESDGGRSMRRWRRRMRREKRGVDRARRHVRQSRSRSRENERGGGGRSGSVDEMSSSVASSSLCSAWTASFDDADGALGDDNRAAPSSFDVVAGLGIDLDLDPHIAEGLGLGPHVFIDAADARGGGSAEGEEDGTGADARCWGRREGGGGSAVASGQRLGRRRSGRLRLYLRRLCRCRRQ